jgi:hypothetical protein
MRVLPIPNRCIWCHGVPPKVSFDISHVLPECVGNENQQVLPKGIVCRDCNNYFGTKIEPILLDDPFFHVIAVVLGLVDPDDMNVFRNRVFDDSHKPLSPPNSSLSVHATVSKNELTLDVAYTIQGKMGKTYTPRILSLLSRAVHKIAFESLADMIYVRGIENPPDLFSPTMNPTRLWARYGQPRSAVRPVLRRFGGEMRLQWETRLWVLGESLGCEICLFGDWYGVCFTDSNDLALRHLCEWGKSESKGIWLLGNSMTPLNFKPIAPHQIAKRRNKGKRDNPR